MKHLLTFAFVLVVVGAAHGQKTVALNEDGGFRLKPLVRLGDMRWRANFGIRALAFSPDGKSLAVTGDRSVGIWDVATGLRRAERKKSDRDSFWSLAWAPDGTLIAAGQDHDILAWDAAGKLRHTLKGHKHVVRLLSLSADGATLASLDVAPKVAIWDVATGQMRREFPFKHLGTWPTIALSPDGKWLATNGPVKEPIQIWDVVTGERVRVFTDKITYEQHLKLVFTLDSQRLIAAGNDDLRIWDVATGELLREIKNAYRSAAEVLVVTPDGKRCAVNSSESIKVWDIATGRLHQTFEAPGQSLWSLAYSRDGKTAAAANLSLLINLWNAETGQSLTPGEGHTCSVDAVAWVAPQRVLTTGRDKSLRYWDAVAGRLEKAERTPVGLLWPRVLSADGLRVAGNYAQGGLGVFDIASGAEKAAAPLGGNWIVPFTPAGLAPFVAFAEPRPSKLNVTTAPLGNSITLNGPDRAIHSFAVSPGGKLVAVGHEQKYDGEYPRVARAQFDGPPKIPPRRKDPTIFLYDAATGVERGRFGELLASVTSLAFAPNGRILVAHSDHRLHILDVHSGQITSSPPSSAGWTDGLAFSPDGRLLVSRGDLGLWETATLTRVAKLEGHALQCTATAFSPDGRRLLTGSADTTAAIWDLTTIAPQGVLPKLTLTAAEIEENWRQLSSAAVGQFYPALWKMIAAGDASVSFVRRQLQSAPHLEPAKVKGWLADIDHEQFARRAEATRQLELHGPAVAADLSELLKTKLTLEKRRRVEQLLQTAGPTAERIRAHRALMILEQLGSAEAQAVLDAIAQGEPRDPLTRDSQESLARLRHK